MGTPLAILLLVVFGCLVGGALVIEKLRAGRRYAIVAIAVIAALLPTLDPLTLLLEMIPLILLYELSIWLASALGRPSPEVSEQIVSAAGS